MKLYWLWELVLDSLKNLVRHKTRSTLTLLGIVFGVASVITMLAIGEGAQKSVLSEIAGLGLKNIIIDSVKPPETSSKKPAGRYRIFSYGLTERDFRQMKSVLPEAELTRALWANQKVYSQGHRLNATTYGVPPHYFKLFNGEVDKGRLLSPIDELKKHRVAVVSKMIGQSLLGLGSPVGKTIKIGRLHFEVVGQVDMPALKNKGMIFIPFATASSVFGTTTVKREAGSSEYTKTEIGRIVVHVKDELKVPGYALHIKRTLEKSHENIDYSTTVPLDILRSKQRTQRIFNLVLITIAAISLLVGGIGIMNIMLAIVMERIREIGIRRAIGARKQDIFMQFLSETLTLSSLGGLTGCILGVSVVPIASKWTGWPGIITAQAILLSLIVSWCVGLVFGTAPALRAAQLNPVDALRYE